MYKYSELKPTVLTDEGQRLFLAIRDRTHWLIKTAGAARCQEIIAEASGDGWKILACVDRMVELGEIRELTNGDTLTQHRVFVSGKD